MKVTRKQLRGIISEHIELLKEEEYDCIKDYMLMGFSRSEAIKKCREPDDRSGGQYNRSRYQPKPRKTSYVGAGANVEKIGAVESALDAKSGRHEFLQSILKQLKAGRGLSAKQNAVVKKILVKIDPESASLFETNRKEAYGKILSENLYKLVKKHAVGGGGRTMNDMIDDAMEDPMFKDLGATKDELLDAFDDYMDDLAGY